VQIIYLLITGMEGKDKTDSEAWYESIKHLVRKPTEEEREAWLQEQKEWGLKYKEMSYTERVDYWSGSIYRDMRQQGESTGNEYSWLSPKWYEEVKATEPEFDKILVDVMKRLGVMVKPDLFYHAIGQRKPDE
jgi:predicted AlkP superfamily phosphohydrolase/phosphomutase